MFAIRTLLMTYDVIQTKTFKPRVYKGSRLYLQLTWSFALEMVNDEMSNIALEEFLTEFRCNKNIKRIALFCYVTHVNPALLGMDTYYEV